jgi:hypothetical protein
MLAGAAVWEEAGEGAVGVEESGVMAWRMEGVVWMVLRRVIRIGT